LSEYTPWPPNDSRDDNVMLIKNAGTNICIISQPHVDFHMATVPSKRSLSPQCSPASSYVHQQYLIAAITNIYKKKKVVCGNFESNYIPKKNYIFAQNKKCSKLHINNVREMMECCFMIVLNVTPCKCATLFPVSIF
jgi:hypothetical protein